jgi:hypothetical protein
MTASSKKLTSTSRKERIAKTKKYSYGNPALKSKLEKQMHDKLTEILGKRIMKSAYEKTKLEYIIPESTHVYTPDFEIRSNVFIETKGIFDRDDRKKMLLVKEQHPDVTIYMFFSNSNAKIYKGSKTSYAMWCEKYGFEYSDIKKGLPDEWFKN